MLHDTPVLTDLRSVYPILTRSDCPWSAHTCEIKILLFVPVAVVRISADHPANFGSAESEI